MKAMNRAGAFLAIAVMALAGCSATLKVSSDYNPEVDFKKLRTFAWLPSPPAKDSDPRAASGLLAGRVQRAAIADLTAKGFVNVAPSASPDFYVTYHAAIDKKMSVRSTPTTYGGYGYGYGYRGWWAPMPPMTSGVSVQQYELGTLIIDIVDRERDDLVWRGSGQAKLSKKDRRTSSERDVFVADAVKKILATFPPAGPKG